MPELILISVPLPSIRSDIFSTPSQLTTPKTGSGEIIVIKHIAASSTRFLVKMSTTQDANLSTNFKYNTPSVTYGSYEFWFDGFFSTSGFITKTQQVLQTDGETTYYSLPSTATIPSDIINLLQPKNYNIASIVETGLQKDPLTAIPVTNISFLYKLQENVSMEIVGLAE